MPPWRNWLAHPPSKREVAGSIPVGGIQYVIIFIIPHSLVVRICRFHRQGRGSIPRGGVQYVLLFIIFFITFYFFIKIRLGGLGV